MVRRLQFVDVGKRLEDESIDSALGQTLHLLREELGCLLSSGWSERLDADSQWSYSTDHQRSTVRRTPGEGDGRCVDPPGFILESEARQLDRVSSERVRLDDFSAALHIIRMHAMYEVRLFDVQLVVAHVHKHAATVQHRAHGAVDNMNTSVVQQVTQRVGHDVSPLGS